MKGAFPRQDDTKAVVDDWWDSMKGELDKAGYASEGIKKKQHILSKTTGIQADEIFKTDKGLNFTQFLEKSFNPDGTVLTHTRRNLRNAFDYYKDKGLSDRQVFNVLRHIHTNYDISLSRGQVSAFGDLAETFKKSFPADHPIQSQVDDYIVDKTQQLKKAEAQGTLKSTLKKISEEFDIEAKPDVPSAPRVEPVAPRVEPAAKPVSEMTDEEWIEHRKRQRGTSVRPVPRSFIDGGYVD